VRVVGEDARCSRRAKVGNIADLVHELSLVPGLVVAHKAERLLVVPPLPSVHIENTPTTFLYGGQLPRGLEVSGPSPGRRRNIHLLERVAAHETLTRAWRHVDWNGCCPRSRPCSRRSATTPMLSSDVRARCALGAPPGRPPVKSIRQAWWTPCKKAKLVGLIPHDFRRSAVRCLEWAGISRSVP